MAVDSSYLFNSCVLIEDDPSHALLVKKAIRDFCAETFHFETLKSAIEFLQSGNRSFDLIVTDLNLPDSSKAENVGKLQAVCPACPVVVLTSSTSLEDAVQAMKLGARDFIVKNFDRNFREILHLSLSRVCATLMMEEERRRLQRETDALRHAIESSNDGMAVTDWSGRVVYANRSFAGFVRRCAGDAASLKTLVGESVENAARLRENIEKKLNALSAGAVWHTEIRFKDDKELAYDLGLSVIGASRETAPDASQATSPMQNEFVVWVKNITEERRREKFQREILSTTTHDLKGPLGTILLSTEVIGPLVASDPKASDIVRRIASLSIGATTLIDEFLSARRIKEGTFILKPQKHDVISLAHDVLESLEPMALVKNIALQIESDQSALDWCFDRLGMTRVLGNLVNNAIKFTPKNGSISIKPYVSDDELHISVVDTGGGMEPAEVNQLFHKFSRLERHTDVPGTGIGLFVVKSIVGAHGGRVEVTSQIGKGTSFDVILPPNPPVNERGELISLEAI